MMYLRVFLSFLASTLLLALPIRVLSADEADEASPWTFTLQPVKIDPVGTEQQIPWFIHVETLEVRSAPSLGKSRVLGSVAQDTEVHGEYVIVEESDEEWLEVDFMGQPGYLLRLGFSRVHPRNQEMIERHGNLPYGKEIVNRWWGIPLDYEADDLVELPLEYTRKVEDREYRLRREAAESLMKMMDAMREDGLEIFVSSPYRSGPTQQSIYTRNMKRRPNQRSSAPPGHSEHQLGATVDLSSAREGRRSLRNSDPQHAWLVENGADYGWRQTYLADNTHETGYIEEPWHWRYVGIDHAKARSTQTIEEERD